MAGAVVLGRWALTETATPAAGVFSLAFRRTADGWRIVHDHTSVDPTPGTDGAARRSESP